jgi:hypothetical protein
VAARRRLLSDVTPLRESGQYRLLYAGELLAFLGSQLKEFAHYRDVRPDRLQDPVVLVMRKLL